MLGVIAFSILGILFVVGFAYWNQQIEWAERELPKLVDKLRTFDREPSVIVSDDGVVLFREIPEHRKFVTFDKIPQDVINATLAAEDKRFLQHEGVDLYALGRIAAVALSSGKTSQGGSTLSMQMAKMLSSKGEKTLERKIRDMAIATVLERVKSKQEIIEIYLNESYFGSGAYGVVAAADIYFGKSLEELTVAEAATLARCVRSPNRENPIRSPEKAKFNRDLVLQSMREEQWLSEEEYQHAIKEKLVVRSSKRPTLRSTKKLPYFVDFVLEELRRDVPDCDFSTGGYRVETTIDTRLQQQIEDTLRSRIRAYRGSDVNIGAFLCMDKDGRIVSMANSTMYSESQYNLTWHARLQPGSAFKPFIYSAAFERGVLSPYGTVSNDPYYIRDRGAKRLIKSTGSSGSVSIRSALAHSYNRAAMWAQKSIGLDQAMDTARGAFGFTHLKDNIETTPLGSNEVTMYEMVQAYSVFQSNGSRVKPFAIKRVISHDGTVLKSNEPQKTNNVLSMDSAQGMDRLLRAVVEDGTGKGASGAKNARGKTGTTSDYKDAWFVGYTNRYVAAVWIANQYKDKSGRVVRGQMESVMGSEFAAPLWGKLVSEVIDRFGDVPLDPNSVAAAAKVVESRESDDLERDQSTPEVNERFFDTGDTTPDRALGDDGGPPVSTSEGDPAPEPARQEPPTPAKTPAREPEPEPDRPAEDSGYVYVKVCSDTGQVASSRCPQPVRLPFTRGSQPRTRCQLH